MVQAVFTETALPKICDRAVERIMFDLPRHVKHQFTFSLSVDFNKTVKTVTVVVGNLFNVAKRFPLSVVWGSAAAGYTTKYIQSWIWNKK